MGAWQVVSAILNPPDDDTDEHARMAEVTIVNDYGRQLILEVSHSYLALAQQLNRRNPAALDDLELPAAAIQSVREI